MGRDQRRVLSCGGATHENLVQEVLDELLLERSRGEQTVKVGAEEFGDEVAWVVSVGVGKRAGGGQSLHVFQRRDEDVAQTDHLEPVRGGLNMVGACVCPHSRVSDA